jgi:hypothetical protein
MIQKLRKIPDVKVEVKGPRMYGGIELPTIAYEEFYHFDNLVLRLRGGLGSYAGSIYDEVNRELIAEQIDHVEWWTLYKKVV